MRKLIAVAALCLMPLLSAHATTGLELRHGSTQELEKISLQQINDSQFMERYVMDVEGAVNIFRAYTENGYQPLHAIIFTNWDIASIVSKIENMPVDESVKKSVESLMQFYTSVN